MIDMCINTNTIVSCDILQMKRRKTIDSAIDDIMIGTKQQR